MAHADLDEPLRPLFDRALDEANAWRQSVDAQPASGLPRFAGWLRGARQLQVDLSCKEPGDSRADLIILTRRAAKLLADFLAGPWAAVCVTADRKMDLSLEAARWLEGTLKCLVNAHEELLTAPMRRSACGHEPDEAAAEVRADLQALADEMHAKGMAVAKRLPTAHRLIVLCASVSPPPEED